MNKISVRKSEIDLEISALKYERQFLDCIESSLSSHPNLIRDDDTFNAKSRIKVYYLALVTDHLSQPDPLLYGGSKTKEIFAAISGKVEEIRSTQADAEASKRGGEDENEPPQILSGLYALPRDIIDTDLNYNTLRSHLTRFKDEGRLFFDPTNKKWRITEATIQVSEAHSDEELKEHWGRTPKNSAPTKFPSGTAQPDGSL